MAVNLYMHINSAIWNAKTQSPKLALFFWRFDKKFLWEVKYFTVCEKKDILIVFVFGKSFLLCYVVIAKIGETMSQSN